MNIYVTNLENAIDNDKLKEIFSSYGEVSSSEVVKDVFTGASRGFGYVEMEDDAARKAITALDQSVVNTLTITVKEAPEIKAQKGSYKVGNGAVNTYRFKKN